MEEMNMLRWNIVALEDLEMTDTLECIREQLMAESMVMDVGPIEAKNIKIIKEGK